jgi:hypothetical protein
MRPNEEGKRVVGRKIEKKSKKNRKKIEKKSKKNRKKIEKKNRSLHRMYSFIEVKHCNSLKNVLFWGSETCSRDNPPKTVKNFLSDQKRNLRVLNSRRRVDDGR